MAKQPRSEYLVRRYEHNHFRGWVVSAKRKGKKITSYFSDKSRGPSAAFQTAKRFRNDLVANLPPPLRIKRQYVRNTTGVIGVARLKERTRRGRTMIRYVAKWPRLGRTDGKATFSVAYYGESEAFRLAVVARSEGLDALMKEAAVAMKEKLKSSNIG